MLYNSRIVGEEGVAFVSVSLHMIVWWSCHSHIFLFIVKDAVLDCCFIHSAGINKSSMLLEVANQLVWVPVSCSCCCYCFNIEFPLSDFL